MIRDWAGKVYEIVEDVYFWIKSKPSDKKWKDYKTWLELAEEGGGRWAYIRQVYVGVGERRFLWWWLLRWVVGVVKRVGLEIKGTLVKKFKVEQLMLIGFKKVGSLKLLIRRQGVVDLGFSWEAKVKRIVKNEVLCVLKIVFVIETMRKFIMSLMQVFNFRVEANWLKRINVSQLMQPKMQKIVNLIELLKGQSMVNFLFSWGAEAKNFIKAVVSSVKNVKFVVNAGFKIGLGLIEVLGINQIVSPNIMVYNWWLNNTTWTALAQRNNGLWYRA